LQIKDFCFVTDGQHGYHEIDESSPISHITAKNAKNWFADKIGADPLAKWVDDNNQRSSLQVNDIILSTRGTVGCCALVSEDILPANIDQDVARIEVLQNTVLPEYLLAYINSQIGQDWIQRNQTGMVQQGLTLSKVKDMPIPKLSHNFQNIIQKTVKTAKSKKQESQTLYQQAETELLEALGLGQASLPTAEPINYNIKNFSDSFLSAERIDAEYYQKKYEVLEGKIKSYSKGYKRLGNIVHIKKSIETGSDAYGDSGVPYVRVSDINKYGISTPNVCISPAYYQRNSEALDSLKLKKDTVLLSKDGSIGIAYKVSEDLDMITSGALLHLTVKNKQEILPDCLTLILNSEIVQKQAERDSGGSIIVHWRVSEIENVMIPLLDFETQTRLASRVQASFALRQESEALLALAKRAVETAIEAGEAEAEKLLSF
jgi:restriction endonuclease S subunit